MGLHLRISTSGSHKDGPHSAQGPPHSSSDHPQQPHTTSTQPALLEQKGILSRDSDITPQQICSGLAKWESVTTPTICNAKSIQQSHRYSFWHFPHRLTTVHSLEKSGEPTCGFAPFQSIAPGIGDDIPSYLDRSWAQSDTPQNLNYAWF